MKRKINIAFLEAYISVETLCAERYSKKSGGVTEYINRLIEARCALKRDEFLTKLVRYRNLRNRFAHEEGALSADNGIARADVSWLKKFKRALESGRDPVARYVKKEKRYARWHKVRRVLLVIAALSFAAAIIYGVMNFGKIISLFA